MRLLEFFNEAQEVELRSPGTLQKVLDAFLSMTSQSDELDPELQSAEARCAVLRSRLDQSKEAGFDKHGPSSGQYGKLALDADDMRAVAVALKHAGTPEDAQKLRDDLRGMRVEAIGLEDEPTDPEKTIVRQPQLGIEDEPVIDLHPSDELPTDAELAQFHSMDWSQFNDPAPEHTRAVSLPLPKPQPKKPGLMNRIFGRKAEGLSGNGFEGLGGRGDGFEVQNQGVTRRFPGEGPKVNGGRSQSQRLDSYDQPQFSPTNRFNIMRKEEALPEAGEFKDLSDDEIDRAVSQIAGVPEPEPVPRVWTNPDFKPEPPPVLPYAPSLKGVFDPGRKSGTSGYDFTQDNERIARAVAAANKQHGIKVEEFMGVRDERGFDKQDPHQGTQEAGPIGEVKLPGSDLEWEETHSGRQFILNTEFGRWSVHQAQGKWVHVFYPIEGLRVPYEDGYAPTPGHAMQVAEKQYEKLRSDPFTGVDPGEETEMWGQFPVPKRKPLMNSYDRSDEAADVSARLKKSSEKEKREHPWATKAQAMRIARDHEREKKNEGTIRLVEFYGLSESRVKYYTLEPEANGMGRLLAWEDAGDEQDEFMMHEPLASGNLDELLAALYKEAPKAQQADDQLRQTFEQVVSDGGEAVYFDPYGLTVDITTKADKKSEKTEPDDYEQYRRDNPNRYF